MRLHLLPNPNLPTIKVNGDRANRNLSAANYTKQTIIPTIRNISKSGTEYYYLMPDFFISGSILSYKERLFELYRKVWYVIISQFCNKL